MVMLLGVGKSATINFIFDEMVFGTDTFQMVRFALQMLVKVLEVEMLYSIDLSWLLNYLSLDCLFYIY